MSYPHEGDPTEQLYVLSIPPMGDAAMSTTPFGGKVEVMLRLAGLEYTAVAGDPADKRTTPKGKFPNLQHGQNVVPDSSTIFQYLQNTYPKEMSVFSPPDARTAALAHSLQRMLEEHSYFAVVYMLWQRNEVAKEYAPRMLATFLPLPTFLISLVSSFFRSVYARTLHGQGMGRFSLQEVKERLAMDLDACSVLLQESGAYLSGSTPCQADCFLFAMMHLALEGYVDLPHKPMYAQLLQQQPVLLDFYNRMWPQVFTGASAGTPDSRWSPGKAPKLAPAPKDGVGKAGPWALPAVVAGMVVVGVGVWLAVRP